MRKIDDIKKLMQVSNLLRQTVIKMLLKAGSGHTAGPLGMADIFACLYFNVAKHDPKKPDWENRDRIILSNGHICPVRYAAMAFAGYFPMIFHVNPLNSHWCDRSTKDINILNEFH